MRLPVVGVGGEASLSIKQRALARYLSLHLCFERLFKRPTDQPLHAANVSNIQSKPRHPQENKFLKFSPAREEIIRIQWVYLQQFF